MIRLNWFQNDGQLFLSPLKEGKRRGGREGRLIFGLCSSDPSLCCTITVLAGGADPAGEADLAWEECIERIDGAGEIMGRTGVVLAGVAL